MSKLNLLVQRVSAEAADINRYELIDPQGDALPEFSAGAHIDLEIPGGFVRQYSLCNDPRDRYRYVVAVLKAQNGAGGSRSLHDRVRAGDFITASPPRNHFALVPEGRRHLLLAGGIGVTPVMAMIEQLEAWGSDFVLHYCTRSPERTPFRGRLRALVERGQVFHHHDQGDPAKGLDIAGLLARYEPGTHLYYCGPTSFMLAARRAAAHWPTGAVHFEYFAPTPKPPSDASPSEAGNIAFNVKVARSGQTFEVPLEKSIVDVLREHGIDVETSCEVGTCGTCKTRYLAGVPQHSDYVLTDREQTEWVMICCARAKTPLLVLDL